MKNRKKIFSRSRVHIRKVKKTRKIRKYFLCFLNLGISNLVCDFACVFLFCVLRKKKLICGYFFSLLSDTRNKVRIFFWLVILGVLIVCEIGNFWVAWMVFELGGFLRSFWCELNDGILFNWVGFESSKNFFKVSHSYLIFCDFSVLLNF